MPIPTSGPVSFSDINTELQRSSTNTLSMSDGDLRALFEDTVGDISISTGRGKSWITPGVSDYQTAGTYTWLSPLRGWNTLQVQIWGGGGGGAGTPSIGKHSATYPAGGTGGQSNFRNAMFANGGTGGAGPSNSVGGVNGGQGGTASGGDINTTGGARAGQNGGSSPNGGAQGSGNFPGGGGRGGGAPAGYFPGLGGGGGGYSSKTHTGYSQIAKNTGYSLVVAAGGSAPGGATGGSRGRVYINWS